MVGQRFMENLLEVDTENKCTIATFCEEPRAAYNRVKLTSFFETRDPSALTMTSDFEEDGTTKIFGKIWVKLDLNQDMPMVKHSVPSSPVSDRHGVVMAFKIPSPLPSVLKIDRRESALHIK